MQSANKDQYIFYIIRKPGGNLRVEKTTPDGYRNLMRFYVEEPNENPDLKILIPR